MDAVEKRRRDLHLNRGVPPKRVVLEIVGGEICQQQGVSCEGTKEHACGEPIQGSPSQRAVVIDDTHRLEAPVLIVVIISRAYRGGCCRQSDSLFVPWQPSTPLSHSGCRYCRTPWACNVCAPRQRRYARGSGKGGKVSASSQETSPLSTSSRTWRTTARSRG